MVILLVLAFIAALLYTMFYYVLPEWNLAESLAAQGKFDEATYHLVKYLVTTILLLVVTNSVFPSYKDK